MHGARAWCVERPEAPVIWSDNGRVGVKIRVGLLLVEVPVVGALWFEVTSKKVGDLGDDVVRGALSGLVC